MFLDSQYLLAALYLLYTIFNLYFVTSRLLWLSLRNNSAGRGFPWSRNVPRNLCYGVFICFGNITNSFLVVGDNFRVKTCSPKYVSQCDLCLSGFAGHIIKTGNNPEDLTEIRVLTAFQRIAKQKREVQRLLQLVNSFLFLYILADLISFLEIQRL